MKKIVSVLLVTLMLLGVFVINTSAYTDEDYKNLVFTEYAFWVEGELSAKQMRGFGATSDGKYLLAGLLNPKGTATVDIIEIATKTVVGKYQHFEEDGTTVSYVKGIATDDRGYMYGGIANQANNGAVWFSIVDLSDVTKPKQVYHESIAISGKAGINGIAVQNVGGTYYMYFVVNYDNERLYCYDVTDVTAPKLVTTFGDNSGYQDLAKLGLKEGSYLDVDVDGTIYLAGIDPSNGCHVYVFSSDGKTITFTKPVTEIYSTRIYDNYLIAATKEKYAAKILILDKTTLDTIAEYKPESSMTFSLALIAGGRIYVADAGYAGGDRILVSNIIGEKPEETTVPETTAAPVTTAKPTTTAKPETTAKPSDTTVAAAVADTTAKPADNTTKAPEKKDGCGKSGAFLALAQLMLIGTAVVIFVKKK